LWPYAEVGHTQDAKKELLTHVTFEHTDNVLDTVKPVALVRRMLQLATRPAEGDLVLDFFAGSGVTGHAVLAQNAEDGGNRRFILVQLPEPLPKPEARLKTIADICKERVRRVIRKLDEQDAGQLDLESGRRQDRGFRVFKLAESNFKVWDADAARDAESLARQLDLHVDHIREGRSEQDILFELLLKSGFPLTTPVEPRTLAGKTVHRVADGAMLICLERDLTLEAIRPMAAERPARVVCLDAGFAGNDQLKANAVQTFKTAGVAKFQTV
jgi:adenine-specific DNA-methyltransferase